MKKLSALVCIFLCLASPTAADMGVEEIMSNFERASRLPNLTGTFTVQMISRKGDVREIEAIAYQKVAGESQMNRLFIFEFPPTVRDTALLIHSYFDGTQDTMWIYLPAVRRIKRIALEQSGGGYFMGSDFTFADFIVKGRDDYERELQGEELVEGRRCYKIRDWAVTLEQRQNMGYSYTVNYYGTEDCFLYARDYYDLSGNLLKTYRVKEVFRSSDWLYPTLVEMHNVQTDHRSIIQVSEYNTEEVPDSIFSTRYLKNR